MQDRIAAAALVKFSSTKNLVLSVLTYPLLLPLANGNSPRGWANKMPLRADDAPFALKYLLYLLF